MKMKLIDEEEFKNSLGFFIVHFRELEKKALEVGIIEKSDIKTLSEMRSEAFLSYLIFKSERLKYMIENKDFYKDSSVLVSKEFEK